MLEIQNFPFQVSKRKKRKRLNFRIPGAVERAICSQKVDFQGVAIVTKHFFP
jgi:hypothetical protein